MGKVSTHARAIHLNGSNRSLRRWSKTPAPKTAEDFAWVVDAGNPHIDKMLNPTAETRSEAKPNAGLLGANSEKRFIMLLPPKSVPKDITTADVNTAHNGTATVWGWSGLVRIVARVSRPANF